jgi:DUF4097 and DUF4098 domain-containing protein YvlB
MTSTPPPGGGTNASRGGRSARSGCAVITGVLLIGIGSVFLAVNVLSFVGVSSLRVGIQVLAWYGVYWPLLFIAWGAYKIFERVKHPGRSYVTAPEIVVLVWILISGLAIRGVGRIAEEVATDVSLEDFASLFGSEFLGPTHRAVDDASFELVNTRVLVIDNGHGDVVIRGADEPRLRVTMTKQIHGFSDTDVDSAFAAVHLDFSGDGQGEPSRFARLKISRGERARGVRTDLEIQVPKNVSVKLSNARGSVRLEDLTALAEIKTTHGDVEVTNLSAGLDVETKFATIRLDRISGQVTAKNQHGSISAIHVDGDVTATTEHSLVTAEHVTGTLHLRTDHGSVRAADIGGSVEITSPYSEVSVERAGGDVSVRASHRPVFVHDVAGGLEVVARSARILVRGVAGDVSIDGRHRPVSVADVQGKVSVIGEQNAVYVDSVGGAVSVESSHEDVHVSNFAVGLTIRTSHADVGVDVSRVNDAIEVETSYGNVSLALPASASVQLQATNRDGGFSSELPELAGELDAGERSDGQRRWEGALGDGIHRVTLATSYGDIVLTRVSP